jgi:hypothetical protein
MEGSETLSCRQPRDVQFCLMYQNAKRYGRIPGNPFQLRDTSRGSVEINASSHFVCGTPMGVNMSNFLLSELLFLQVWRRYPH